MKVRKNRSMYKEDKYRKVENEKREIAQKVKTRRNEEAVELRKKTKGK